MSEKQQKRNIIILLILVVALLAYVCVDFVKDKKEEKQGREFVAEATNQLYTEYLCVKGDFTYKGKKVIGENLTYYDNRVLERVAFYNYNNKTTITKEQLYQEYDAFCQGKDEGNYNNLDAFVEYLADYSIELADFEKSIRSELPDGVGINEATLEELQQAIDQALLKL